MMATPAAGFGQPAIRPSVSRDDESSSSPEPSPLAPPVPQEYPRQGSWAAPRGAWTPSRSATADDQSLLSVPEAPSPYSPPPASLFSGQEWGPKSVRKTRPPMREIHAHVQTAPTPATTGRRMHNLPSTDHRSTLGPAVRQLTEKLEQSNQAYYLLQEENKALVHENQEYRTKLEEICSLTGAQQERMREMEAALKEQMEQWNEANHSIVSERHAWEQHDHELQEKLDTLQKDLDLERQEVAQLTHQCDTLQESHASNSQEKNGLLQELQEARERASKSESHHTVLLEKMDSLQSEIRNTESAKQVEQCLQSTADRLELELEDAKKQTGDLSVAQENLTIELQSTRNRAMAAEKERETLKETVWELHNKVVALKQVEEKVLTIEEQLSTERRRSKDLAADLHRAETAASEVADDQGILATQLAAARDRLYSAEEEKSRLEGELHTLQTSSRDTKDRLSSQREQASKRLQEVRNELEEKEKKLTEEAASCKLEIDRLKATILEAEKKTTRQIAGAETKHMELETELAKLRAAQQESNTTIADLRAEKVALRLELAENLRSIRDAGTQTEGPVTLLFAEGATQTDANDALQGATSSNSQSVSDRLGRIRDAAERAAHLQDYRREISRHKDEHKAELKRLSEEHDDQLREVMQEAKAEVHSRTREYRRRLKAQHQEELNELDRRHDEELNEIKKDYEKRATVAEDVMQAAMNEVTSTTKQLEAECAARESLQKAVQALEQELEAEKLKKPEIESRVRREMLQEANCLVDSIKQECNTVFDRSKNVTNAPSPRSVLMEFPTMEPKKATANKQFQPIRIETTPDPDFEGSVCSDMDRVLDETEALVRSLMV